MRSACGLEKSVARQVVPFFVFVPYSTVRQSYRAGKALSNQNSVEQETCYLFDKAFRHGSSLQVDDVTSDILLPHGTHSSLASS